MAEQAFVDEYMRQGFDRETAEAYAEAEEFHRALMAPPVVDSAQNPPTFQIDEDEFDRELAARRGYGDEAPEYVESPEVAGRDPEWEYDLTGAKVRRKSDIPHGWRR